MKKILDLRFKGNLDKENKILFNKIANESIKDFNFFIDSISKQFNSNLYWWISSISSRDTPYSPLFFYFVALILLNKKIESKQKIYSIITDSKEFAKIINNFLLRKSIKVDVKLINNIKNKYILRISSIFFLIKFSLLLLFKLFINFAFKIILGSNIKNIKNDNLILVDTTIINEYSNNDRSYSNLYDLLEKDDKKKFYYVPTIVTYNIFKIIKIYFNLKKNKNKFLLKEDFISFLDLFYLIDYHLWKRKIKINTFVFLECSFTNLLYEQIHLDNRYQLIYESIITYHFIKRLSLKKIKIKCSIDWFENQIIDRAWNLGFNKYFGYSKLKGYRGLIPANFLLSQMHPTKQEFISGVLPKEIFVIGKGLVDDCNKYLSKNLVKVAPALRFQHLFNSSKNNNLSLQNNDYICVALPSLFNLSLDILKIINKIDFKENHLVNVKFLIKSHPLINLNEIIRHIDKINYQHIEFTNDKFSNIINKSILLISCLSSTCLESISLGKPVLIFNPSQTMNFISIPEKIDNKLWKVCYDEDDLIKNIQLYFSLDHAELKENKIIAKKITSDYFQTVSKKNIIDFIS